MKKVHMIYTQYLDNNGEKKQIGGVETYLQNLAEVADENGFIPVIYQFAQRSFEKRVGNVKVVGVRVRNEKNYQASARELVKKIEETADVDSDILVFATDYLICKNNFRKSVAIQHGVAWDITNDRANRMENVSFFIKGIMRSLWFRMKYNKCTDLVCVDYNFLNWYRTQFKSTNIQIHPILNFADYENTACARDESEPIKILFARRFVTYRGTDLFIAASKKILDQNSQVQITFAGEGPEEVTIREAMSIYGNRVTITKYDPQNSIDFHKKFDIAVVCTIGSEGTSLSLLEAMSAGCAVIATNVGGITNILLDNHNGIMIQPNSEELYKAMALLINDRELRCRLASKAQQCICDTFSKKAWKGKWKEVISL